MAQKMPLELVLDKMRSDEKSMTERLEKATAHVREEQQQLQQLQDYYKDYTSKIDQQQQHWPVNRLAHYRSFLSQLVKAVDTQQQKLNQQEQALQEMRQQLMACQHKMSVLSEAIEEQRKSILYQQEKQQQKELDEHASRSSRPFF